MQAEAPWLCCAVLCCAVLCGAMAVLRAVKRRERRRPWLRRAVGSRAYSTACSGLNASRCFPELQLRRLPTLPRLHFCSILFCSVPFYLILFYFIEGYSILLTNILFDSILWRLALQFHSVLCHSFFCSLSRPAQTYSIQFHF